MAISFVAAGAVSTGANPTVAVPAGTAAADLLLLVTTGTAAPTAPTGWTLVSAQGAAQFITVYRKYATSSEASLAVTQAGASTKAVMLAYRGAGAYQVVPTYATGSSTTATTPTLTTTYTNDYVLSIIARTTGVSTLSTPASTTSRVNSSSTATINGFSISDELQAAAGVSTARASTLSLTGAWSAVGIAFIEARTVYWVGSAGTWNNTTTTNWADTSGGAGSKVAPSPWDNVVIDTSSGTGSITCTSASATCQNITVTATQAITLAGTLSLIYGSLSYPTVSSSFTSSAALTFVGTTSGLTISTNSSSIRAAMTINGVGATYTLGSYFNSNNSITLTAGTFNTGSYTVVATAISSSNANVRSLILGSSEVVLSGTTPIDLGTSTNLTLTANSSNIYLIATGNITFNGGGMTFYNVIQVSGGTATNTLNQVNSFNTLQFTPASNAGFSLTYGLQTLSLADDQAVTGSFTDANNSFLESSSNAFTLTKTGSVTPSTLTPFSGSGVSFYCTGANGNYLSIPAASAAAIPTGTNPVTFEGWVYLSPLGMGTLRTMMGKSSSSASQYTLNITTSNIINFGGTGYAGVTGTTVLQPRTWYHIAVTCSGGSGTIWLNGVSEAASATCTMPSYTNLAYFGAADPSNAPFTQPMYGYLSNLRISNVVRYTGTFTPATSPFTSDANTVVLITGTQTSVVVPSLRAYVKSSVAGTNKTITAAAISLTDVDFQNITGAGAVAPFTGTRLGDATGNSGITFTTPKTVYWNLAGAQNWNATGWATSSGGVPADSNFPLPQDTAIFDNTGNVTGTITLNASWNFSTIDMSARTSAMTLATGTLAFSIYGNWLNGTGTTLSGAGIITFAAQGLTRTITCNGAQFTQPTTINAIGGTVQLTDDYVTTGVGTLWTITNGTFDANNKNVTLSAVSLGVGTKSLVMGTGTWSLRNTSTLWDMGTNQTGLTFSGASAPIIFTNIGASLTKVFNAGTGLTYNKITVGGSTGISTYQFTGASTFLELATNKTVASTISFSTTAAPTITTWSASGTAGNLITVNSSTVGTAASISVTNQTSGIDYLSFTDITCTNLQPITFYAGVNSRLNNNVIGIAATTPTSGQYVHVLNSGTSWTVPGTWNNSNNSIHLFGAGGGGATSAFTTPNGAGGAGGGGGGYTQATNVTLSGTIAYAVGAGGSTAATGGTTLFDITTNPADGSGSFVGSATSYLTVPYSTTNFDWFTSGTDYTLECWIYPTDYTSWFSGANVPKAVGNTQRNGVTNYWSFGIRDATGKISFFYFTTVNNAVVSTASVPLNSWSHIAMTKTSSGITVFVNGVAGTTTAISGTPGSSAAQPLTMGAYNNTYGNGYISNLRIVKGTAVYSGNFTPPTAPLTAISGTQLLTLQSSSTITDASTNAYTITNGGAVTANSNTPFYTSSYSAAGGSGGTTTATSSVGGTGGVGLTYNGGAGGSGSTSTVALTGNGGGGGGGSGGPLGIGGAGGNGFAATVAANVAGGGGGGNGGGSAGGNASSATGGTGGNNNAGIGGGASLTVGFNGGGGGGGTNVTVGGSGGSGVDIASAGIGGGGGRGGASAVAAGANTGLFGGGGAGGGLSIANGTFAGGAGAQGGIIIIYSAGVVVYTGSVTENSSIADILSALGLFNTSTTETSTLADTESAQSAYNLSIAEDAILADSGSAQSAYNQTIIEDASIADSNSAQSAYNSSIAEDATYANIESAQVSFNSLTVEDSNIIDVEFTSLVASSDITEPISVDDSNSANFVFVVSITEPSILENLEYYFNLFTSDILENITVEDSSTAQSAYLVSLVETQTSSDTQTVVAIFSAIDTESLSTVDTSSATSVFNASGLEGLSVLDAESAQSLFASTITETSTVASSQATFKLLNPSITESLTSADSSTRTAIFSSSVSETMSAADIVAVQARFASFISEATDIADFLVGYGWFKVVDDQTVVWTGVNDGQTVTWVNVNDAQGSTWIPVNDSQTTSWTSINDGQTPNWTDINDSQP